jgi:hypothetical protein
MSVHMFGLRLMNERVQRSKNGKPAHTTTGVESQFDPALCGRFHPAQPVAEHGQDEHHGRQRQRPQNLRRKSVSSGFSSSSRLGNKGSRAIPHFGQLPGWSWRISGCIGQVYIEPSGAASTDVLVDGLTYRNGSARNFF